MSELVAKPEVAAQLIQFLEQQLMEGKQWVVYDTDHPIASAFELNCFFEEMDAIEHAREYQQFFNWHEAVPISSMLSELKQFESKLLLDDKYHGLQQSDFSTKNNRNMNLNNLGDLKQEMKRLGFADKLISQMEDYMKQNVPDFKLHDTVRATKGQVELTLHFKQSGQSDFYYFNKFEVAHNLGKVLEDGQKYIVISEPLEAGQQKSIKSFQNTQEAIDFFKGQRGNSELAISKGENNQELVSNKNMMANMENGKINFVDKEFQRTFYGSPISQTFWVEKGRGFKAEQAVNLIQGRTVYRDDMMNVSGQAYKAWVKLDFEKGKDKFQNYSTNQFHDPQYGFDLSKVLDRFNIKELEDPAQRELLESSLRNGNRPFVTTEKDGQPMKIFIEAVPRYGQINMYAENGRPEKREQFLKEPAMAATQSKDKAQEVDQRQGMRM